MIQYERRFEGHWIPVTRSGQRWQDGETGEVLELFRIKIFAECTGRTSEVIKDWMKAGHIPLPLFAPEDEQCKHWFSAAQCINAYRVSRFRYGGVKHPGNSEQFKSYVGDLKAIWYQQRVTVNEKGEVK